MITLKVNFFLIFFLMVALAGFSFPQPLTEIYKHLGEMFVPQFSSAPFPHPNRINGHNYDDKRYSFEEHYNHSDIAVFIHTDLTHNEVMSKRKQFRDYLKTSKLPSVFY